MLELIKPKKLKKGDKVATVSLSWGGAGDADLLWRYNVGKMRLQEEFGLVVVEMENTLKGTQFVYENPKKRAEDLMNAFKDPEIKAIFCCIGGDDSIRMLPYIDFEVIRKNPKIFIGYSDTTTSHLMCLKAGISSFYGVSVLAELAENVEIFEYTKTHLKKALFETQPLGEIKPAEEWTGELLEWNEENSGKRKTMQKNRDYEVLQGKGVIQGRLIGGCIEVLEMAKGTPLFPELEKFKGSILFFETSEDTPDPAYLKIWLRNYGSIGILNAVNGIILGKPYQGKFYEEYKQAILKILKELNLTSLPVMYNMTFGHNQPMCVLPYGALAEIDCENAKFSILESAVV